MIQTLAEAGAIEASSSVEMMISFISGPSRLHKAEHIAIAAQEDHAVAGRIPLVPFHLVLRNLDLSANVDMRSSARFIGAIVGDNNERLAVTHMDFVGEIGISLAAT